MPIQPIISPAPSISQTKFLAGLLLIYGLALLPYHEYMHRQEHRWQLMCQARKLWKMSHYSQAAAKFKTAIDESTGCLAGDLRHAYCLDSFATTSGHAYDEPIQAKAYSIYQKRLGPTNVWTLDLAGQRISTFRYNHQFDKANAIADYELICLGPIESIRDKNAFNFLKNLQFLYHDEGHTELALKAGMAAYRLDRPGRKDFQHVLDLHELARIHQDLGKFEESAPLIVEALCVVRNKSITDSFEKSFESYLLHSLSRVYIKRGDYKSAEPLLIEALSKQECYWGSNTPAIGCTLAELVDLYIETKQPEKAQKALDKLSTAYSKDYTPAGKCLRHLLTEAVANRHEIELSSLQREIWLARQAQKEATVETD